MPGIPSSCSPHVRFDRLEVAGSVWLEDDENIRDGVRHRILGPFRPTRSSHDVFDLRHLPQHVLDPMIEPVDFVERRFGRKHRLQQKRAFVQLGHEVAADAQPEHDRRDRDEQCDGRHDDGMAKGTIQRRRVPPLDLREGAQRPRQRLCARASARGLRQLAPV